MWLSDQTSDLSKTTTTTPESESLSLKPAMSRVKVHIFWEGHKIFTLLLTTVHTVKRKVDFSEYMNFTTNNHHWNEVFTYPVVLDSGHDWKCVNLANKLLSNV